MKNENDQKLKADDYSILPTSHKNLLDDYKYKCSTHALLIHVDE